MAEYLKLPLSDYSFEDVRLMTKMENYNLPGLTGQIKVAKLIKALGYVTKKKQNYNFVIIKIFIALTWTPYSR